MNDFQLTPDDPRLTAYALNELEPSERASIESALRSNPELRAAVEDIRLTASRMEAALKAESASPESADAEPPVVAAVLPSPARTRKDEYAIINGSGPSHAARRILRFPQLYYVFGGLAAACFAVLVALRDPQPAAPARKVYQVIELRPAGSDAVTAESAPSEVRVALPSVPASDEMIPPRGLSLLEQVRDPNAGATAAERPPSPPIAFNDVVTAPAPTQLLQGDESRRMTVTGDRRVLEPTVARAVTQGRAVRDPGVAGAAGMDAPRAAAQAHEANEREAVSRAAATAGSRMLAAAQGSAVTRTAAGSLAPGAAGSEAVMLQPFEVSASRESGGAAMAGSRAPGDFTLNLRGPAMAPHSSTDLFPGPRPRSPMPELPAPTPAVPHTTEAYSYLRDNDFLRAALNPLSTFSLDVDTASYANIRRFVQLGRLPPVDAVRIEELINYFPYRYAPPPAVERGAEAPPFAASLEIAAAPWAPGHRLLRIGIKGREVAPEARPAANLVFLLDVSGSMNQANKLPLVKDAMRLLLARLRPDDRVAIVTYAGRSGLALPSTPVSRSREILDALDSLHPGGSTNGGMGIVLAYDIAKANFTRDGVNRVILCTDGDFNVGATSQGELVRMVEEKARSGVFLTVLGFGMHNLKDATLESLADKGNGAYGYIDTHREAEKLLVEEMSGTLVTIAKDVKIQVDFNPAKVASYRLIGYENRVLKQEDFNNDKADAGEVGAGHTVTALYEIVPVGAADQPLPGEVEESKYQPRPVRANLPAAIANEMLTVRVRYKEPTGEVSRKIEFPLTDNDGGFEDASPDFKFSSALAAFGMILRDSPHKGHATIGRVIEWATAGSAGPADDPRGYRREFLDLARRVEKLIRG